MSQLGVVHLVRARNGLKPFTDFLDSFGKYPAGARHDLLIVFKGFSGDAELEPYRTRLKTIPYRELLISDTGLDLHAYSIAARQFEYSYLCFLNSYCGLLQEGWLDKLFAAVRQPEVGAVGATGSWESMYTNFLRKINGARPPFHRRIADTLHLRLNRRLFPPFPNYHLRTNAFIVSRKLMLEVWPRQVLNKPAAYVFETGRNNFTQRILNAGFKPVIIDRTGRAYEKEDWAISNTFRQSNQENLLIADNQTRGYATGDFETRKFLSALAWGDAAKPDQP